MGYIYREILTGLFVIGAFWPAGYGLSFLKDHLALAATWFIACLCMSSFTLLNAMKVEDVNLMYSSPNVPRYLLLVLANVRLVCWEDS